MLLVFEGTDRRRSSYTDLIRSTSLCRYPNYRWRRVTFPLNNFFSNSLPSTPCCLFCFSATSSNKNGARKVQLWLAVVTHISTSVDRGYRLTADRRNRPKMYQDYSLWSYNHPVLPYCYQKDDLSNFFTLHLCFFGVLAFIYFLFLTQMHCIFRCFLSLVHLSVHLMQTASWITCKWTKAQVFRFEVWLKI